MLTRIQLASWSDFFAMRLRTHGLCSAPDLYLEALPGLTGHWPEPNDLILLDYGGRQLLERIVDRFYSTLVVVNHL